MRRLVERLPGKFKVDGVDVSAKTIDISAHGLGVFIEKKMAVGAKTTLVIDGCEMLLEMICGDEITPPTP